MKLDEALEQLDAISAMADRTSTFDGLRAYPTALTALLALAAAAIQGPLLSRSSDPLITYLLLWTGVATVALVIVLAEMALRYHRDPTARSRRMTLEVMTRLAPSIVVGAALTIIVFFSIPDVGWMLPGLWAMLLGLGIYAASPTLPRSLHPVGTWYIGSGLTALILASGESAFSPLAMAVPFGGGQAFAALLIHRVTETKGSQG